MSETAHDAHVSFHTEAVPKGHLLVRSLRRREALGGDYAFERRRVHLSARPPRRRRGRPPSRDDGDGPAS